ncbi:hypothetical protein BD310DRAFT_364774 [Dichomitus squalens]|uniref:Uncharacterized protein n=1 Tax=Dichomitus squalens TaxID=114155 RepID=A0A4Q9PZ97_9APHY|nr:hypothetical protein BD310DRAFT_364774 [Dichomitus squalens]
MSVHGPAGLQIRFYRVCVRRAGDSRRTFRAGAFQVRASTLRCRVAMYSAARRSLAVKYKAPAIGRDFRCSAAMRNLDATLHRSYELGAVEETQNIATMDKLLRTFRDRTDPAHQS